MNFIYDNPHIIGVIYELNTTGFNLNEQFPSKSEFIERVKYTYKCNCLNKSIFKFTPVEVTDENCCVHCGYYAVLFKEKD